MDSSLARKARKPRLKRARDAVIDLTDPNRYCRRSNCVHVTNAHPASVKQVMEKHEADHLRREGKLPKPQIPCQCCDFMLDNDKRSDHTKHRHEEPVPNKVSRRQYQICNQCDQAWWICGRDTLPSARPIKETKNFDYFDEHQKYFCPNRPGCINWKQLESGRWVRKVPIDGPGKHHGRSHQKRNARKVAARQGTNPASGHSSEATSGSAFVSRPRYSLPPPSPSDSRTSLPPSQNHPSNYHPSLCRPYASPQQLGFNVVDDSSSSTNLDQPLEDNTWAFSYNPHLTTPGFNQESAFAGQHGFNPAIFQTPLPSHSPLAAAAQPVSSNEPILPRHGFYNGVWGQHDLPAFAQWGTYTGNHAHEESFFQDPYNFYAPPEYDPHQYGTMTSLLGHGPTITYPNPPSYHQQLLGRRRTRTPRLTHRQALRYGDLFR